MHGQKNIKLYQNLFRKPQENICLGNLQHRMNNLCILMFSLLQVPLYSVNKAAQNLSEPQLVTASTGVVS